MRTDGNGWATIGKLAVTIVVIVAVAAAITFAMLLRHGISARDAPTTTEVVIARSLRHLAVPSSAKTARNPLPLTAEAIAEARAHFADHCAGCHANDGSGQTEMGQSFYPKSPDMRLPETQQLSDGEIFFIIKHGVRLTAMPAWGDPGGRDDAETWKLVHFIRHLPKSTPAEIEMMKGMNPVSRSELQQQKEEEDFLNSDLSKGPSNPQHRQR
jgi:mono/diheme cytochrome c family protein